MMPDTPQQPEVAFVTYAAVDMTNPDNKITPLGTAMPDGTVPVAFGPDVVVKFDYLSINQTIGRLQAIAYEMEHGRQRDQGKDQGRGL